METRTIEGGCITREQWLLRETRTVAQLRRDGIAAEDVVSKARAENIFHYPTERMLSNIARVCNKRIDATDSDAVVDVLIDGDASAACQANMYIMMCTYPLVRDFMLDELARRFEELNYSLDSTDMNSYFSNLEARYDNIAGYSEKTIAKLKQVLRKCLVECGVLANARSTDLIPPILDFGLKEAIVEKGDLEALRAFNCREGL